MFQVVCEGFPDLADGEAGVEHVPPHIISPVHNRHIELGGGLQAHNPSARLAMHNA